MCVTNTAVHGYFPSVHANHVWSSQYCVEKALQRIRSIRFIPKIKRKLIRRHDDLLGVNVCYLRPRTCMWKHTAKTSWWSWPYFGVYAHLVIPRILWFRKVFNKIYIILNDFGCLGDVLSQNGFHHQLRILTNQQQIQYFRAILYWCSVFDCLTSIW